MTATFPTDLTFNNIPQITDGIDYPEAADINPIYDEVNAIEKFLGVNGGSWIGEGQMMNGKLSITVSTNDLTVALKTIAGTDPSALDPVYIRINGTVRKCTAALSKTLADGTNWFNSGSAELAAQEADYFVYAIWNTTPATDIMDLGFARVPFFNVYSEASATTTNEKYLAYANGSAPASTDDMVNIGRFAATLSAGAGYTWTVPTFTTTNLIQRPTFETRPLLWTPAWTNLTVGDATVTYWYQRMGRRLRGAVSLIAGASTSISGSVSHTMPFGRSSTYGATVNFPSWICRLFDATAAPAFQGIANMATTSAVTITAQDASGTYLKQANISSTVPFTWTTSDQIAYDFDYLAD